MRDQRTFKTFYDLFDEFEIDELYKELEREVTGRYADDERLVKKANKLISNLSKFVNEVKKVK